LPRKILLGDVDRTPSFCGTAYH